MTWPHRLFTGQFSDLDIRLIKVFRAVVDCGGFSAAEVELGVVKSTISKQIKALELRIGARLCERGRSGFALTREGQAVYEASTRLVTSLEEFRAEINQFQDTLHGDFSIAMIDALVTKGQSRMHAILAEFTQLYPMLDLRLVIASPNEIDRAVQERRVNVGVSVRRSGVSNLVRFPLHEEEDYLYCSRHHELYDREDAEITSSDLSNCALAYHAYSEVESTMIKKWNLKPAAKCQQMDAIAMLVLTGNFIGFLPDHYAQGWVSKGEMRALTPDKIRKVTQIDMISHKFSSVNPILRQLQSVARSYGP